MMTDIFNTPWDKMHSDAKRRVDDTVHDIFWIKDYQSRYGLMLLFPEGKQGIVNEIHIRGLSNIERSHNGMLEVYLLLNSSEDLELFTVLCGDLIRTANSCKKSDNLFLVIINRLNRWQRFLSAQPTLKLSEQIQMGLFAELLILQAQIVPRIGIGAALECWTGPDFDKKDFSPDNTFIEVKSLISSKGPLVKISSINQLDASLKPLYLIVVNMSRSEKGQSIQDLINIITNIIGYDELLSNTFTDKLTRYGYFEGVTESPFFKWIVDRIICYSVNDSFPKITTANVPAQVTEANYQIDLSRCEEFETNLNLIRI